MSPTIIISRFQAVSEDGQERIISEFQQLESSSKPSGKWPQKCLLCKPRDATADYSTYLIEIQAQENSDRDAGICDRLRNILTKDANILVDEPENYNVKTVASFFRPDAQSHADPYIVFATLRYDSIESAEKAAEGFGGVCAFSEKEEPGTLGYNVLHDVSNPEIVRTFEVYVDQAYLWDPHASSDAVQENKKRQGDTRLGVDFVFLKFVAGIF